MFKAKNKKKKKKKIVEEVPSSRAVKIGIGIVGLIILIEIIFIIIGIFNKEFAYWVWRFIEIPIESIIYTCSQYLVIRIGRFPITLFYLFLVIVLIMLIAHDIVVANKKISKRKKYVIANTIRMIFVVFCFIEFCLYIGLQVMSYNNPKIDYLYFKEEEKKDYSLEDIDKLMVFLEDKVIALAGEVARDKEGKIIFNDDIEDQIVSDLKEASFKYPILKGIYPKKLVKFNDYDLSHDPTTYGMTNLDAVQINYNQPLPQLFNTITHELCHTRGIVRENEAVLCSVITGIESRNAISQYGGYLESYSRVLDALFSIDKKKAIKSEDKISKLCLDYGYDEICNFYSKNTKLYVKKSNMIEIITYNTSFYNDGELEEILESFKNYKPTYYINGKKIKNELKYKDNEHLVITFKNSEEIFIKVQKTLVKYQDRVLAIYQNYPDMYTGVDLSSDEAEKYYTSSIPDSDVTIYFSDEKDEVFDYSRATRLIMEYFDKENIY